MKQGIFDIDTGTPIVVAYGLPEPKEPTWDTIREWIFWYKKHREYESSRQEWEAENTSEFSNRPKGLSTMRISIIKGQRVQFTETQTPKDGKRGKCKIVKIL